MSEIRLKTTTELEVALKRFSSRQEQYQAGATIFSEGDSSHGCYLVVRGALRLTLESRNSDPMFEALADEGCLVGLPATINGHRYSLTCVAASDVELAYISRQDITTLMKRQPDAAFMLLDFLSNEVQTGRKQQYAKTAKDPTGTRSAIN